MFFKAAFALLCSGPDVRLIDPASCSQFVLTCILSPLTTALSCLTKSGLTYLLLILLLTVLVLINKI